MGTWFTYSGSYPTAVDLDEWTERYEEDEVFVRRLIGERVVNRFDRARQSARHFYKRQQPA